MKEILQANDRVLHPLLEAADERAAERAIEELIVRAQGVAGQVVGYYRRRSMLSGDDADEILSAVRHRLFMKLRRLGDSPSEAMASFDGYVAGVTYNAVNDLFRQRYPERTRLKKRLREIARSDARFTTEGTAAGLRCGLAPGRAVDADRSALAEAMSELLEGAGTPMLLEDIVTALVDVEPRFEPESEDLSDSAPTPLVRLEQRSDVRQLWREIQLLRPHQQAALLLNLRGDDGRNMAGLFVLIGVASIDEIAEAVGMPIDELASLWNDLPLDDLRIAARLGLTRQQVINLRKSARDRLARRMRTRGGAQ